LRVLLHTGKGGVGKTSLAVATALGAAAHGHRVFVVSTDSAHSLGDALGTPVGAQAREVAPNVVAQEVSALAELDRSWSEIQAFMHGMLRDDADPLVAEELLVFPGLEELVALRAVLEVERSGDFDVCVVDCAPTGSTLRLLRFPDVLRMVMESLFDFKRRAAKLVRPVANRVGMGRFVAPDSVFEAIERLYQQVSDVRQILLDSDRTSARLVVNPARVVVDETRRSFAYLCLYGVATDAVLVNRVLPVAASGGYFARWAQRERQELAEIEASFPVPLLQVPLHRAEPIGVAALGAIAREAYGERDPAAVFTRTRPIRLVKRAGETLLEIDVPNVPPEEVTVRLHGRELLVTVRDARRRIALPDSVLAREVGETRVDAGVLRVWFAP
jgi:arsenite-transporting ATPase